MEAVPGLGQLSWRLARSHGDAGAFHAAEPEPVRSATFHTVERPTLVLGSAQADEAVDPAAVAALGSGIAVVRRRSGGGAVLLVPGEFVWLDLVLPAGDPLWSDDVGRAMEWVGELWLRAVCELGVRHASVHRGGLVPSAWSRAVCWAGVGTGEVMLEGAKLVGISQRRTRAYARFQTMCHLAWRPEWVSALVAEPRPTVPDLSGLAACVPADEDAVVAALTAALP
jgi:lipoate-protein ligase A